VSVDVDVLLQALGWVTIIGLVTVEMLIRRGRAAAFGPAFRWAGCAAAASVVAASLAERIWPVAVLGLLWLRTEVFGHRRGEARAGRSAPRPEHSAVFVPGFGPREVPRRVPVGAGGPSVLEPEDETDLEPWHLPHPHLPHPHLPHPHLTRRFVDLAFRIEMAVVILIASVLFVVWGQQQRETVGRDANNTMCHWLREC
jgi:hypothetical protein